jgi:zinc transport system permease protein
VLVVLAVFGRELFAMSLDSELAQVQGIRTTLMSTLLTVMAAISVVVGMRTVGLLLVSAIMIVPIAAAQQLTRSFTVTAVIGVGLGLVSTTAGLTSSYYLDVPPGPTIVLIALAIFVLAGLAGYVVRRRNRLARR